MKRLAGPELLTAEHDVNLFDCGVEALNTFLKRHALTNQKSDSARTFVALDHKRVVGFYSLSASHVAHEDAPERMRKGLARHPIPAVLMARFAVDKQYQGLGLGRALFKDAIKRTLSVADELAVRAFIVHAKDEEASALYQHFGMAPFEDQPFHLYLLLKDIRHSLGL